MKNKQEKYGFTIVELLITMFVAVAFLLAGYQLYSLMIKDSSETTMQTRASNLAYEYLQRYKSTATNPCSTQTPATDQSIETDGLYAVKFSVTIYCPYGTGSSISRVKIDLKYGDKSPQQTVSNATYVRAAIDCPDGYIAVPGSLTYNTTDFCVMKYEAKNDGNGNAISTPTGLPWVSIQGFGNSTNVSQGTTATDTSIVDGVVTTNPFYNPGTGLKSVTVDLGSIKDINTIKIWHYFSDGRTFFNTKTEVSTDNTNWTTVFDSATDGVYTETSNGKSISFDAKKVRYIRDWANGSSINTYSLWVEIQAFSPIDAVSKSAAACAGCHIISEAEWMTIAQNVLSVASNWSDGVVGSGYIYSGHNDNVPASPLTADADDSNGYAGTGQSAPSNQRRTLTLTNGEVIWDFAGNVWEFTSGQAIDGQPGIAGETSYSRKEWTDVTDRGSLVVDPSPTGTGLTGANLWNSSNGIGLIHQSYAGSRSSHPISTLRSGSWDNGIDAGILAINLNWAHTSTSSYVGFRVAK